MALQIYDDGYVIRFPDDTLAAFSSFNPFSFGRVVSEESYVVKDLDTLLSIASAYYKDTRYWYIISEWNNLDKPIELVTGTELKLPNFG